MQTTHATAPVTAQTEPTAELQAKPMSHAEAQAEAQVRSIVEMTRRLTIEGAAVEFADTLNRAELAALCEEVSIEVRDEDTEDELREAVADSIAAGDLEPPGFEWDEDGARQAIDEDPLSVEVREPWHAPGDADVKPEEFCILLCTGGPACRIVGDLDSDGQPSRPRVQYQDWGTPWTEYFGMDDEARAAVQTYCEQFYFGE